MWPEIVKYLSQFPNAVLTGLDRDGYPFSLRCTPQVDETNQVLRIANTGGAPLQPGPAGLLCHSHNEQIWDLKSFQVLGRLEQTPEGWVFRPERFLPGNGITGMSGQMQFIFKSRAEAAKYLQKRGLPRPQVHWDEFKALRDEVKKSAS
jgi:hypothetical protein